MTRYRVLGLDRFSYEYYIVGEYDTENQAKTVLYEREKEAEKLSSDSTIADRLWIETVIS